MSKEATEDTEENGDKYEPKEIMERPPKKYNMQMTHDDWYTACETFVRLETKMKATEFLRSDLSNPLLTSCTKSQEQSFGRMLKKYQSGTLRRIKTRTTKKHRDEMIKKSTPSRAVIQMTHNEWYIACDTFSNLKKKMKVTEFFRSDLSTPILSQCTKSQEQSFGRMMKKYKNGTLKPISKKKHRSRKYIAIEEKVIHYIQSNPESKISWISLQAKTKEWASELKLNDFRGSSGWLNETLKRYGISNIHTYGPAVINIMGAGTREVNGNYYPSKEKHNDYPIYVKREKYQQRHDPYLFVIRRDIEHWTISAVERSTNSLKYDQVRYYYTDGCNGLPSKCQWRLLEPDGSAPLPRVFTNDLGITTDEEVVTMDSRTQLLFSIDFSNVHFQCSDGTLLHAHTDILSAVSSYFQTAFSDPWTDDHPNGVCPIDVSSQLMKIILKYMYTGVIDTDEISKRSLDVLELASEFYLSKLMHIIETVLTRQIQFNNVKDLLQHASYYNLHRLKTCCFEFIHQDAINILMDGEFLKLTTEDKKLWEELRIHLNRLRCKEN